MRLTEGLSLHGQSVDVHPDTGGWWMTGTEREAEAARGACGLSVFTEDLPSMPYTSEGK